MTLRNQEDREIDLYRRTITSVEAGASVADIHLDNGATLKLTLDGDCCSKSYFTDLKQFDSLVGKRIYDAEEREGPTTGNQDETVLNWHFLVFRLDDEWITIDWRNESNGYYDGTLTASLVTP